MQRRWDDNRNKRMSSNKALDLDSTQSMRAIDPAELYDSHRPKWYAVQLVVSDRPVNLDMMPRLEVFAAHRLYAIAAKQQSGTWHALRLGFFPDEESAQRICGYLQTFFASPSIVRVSVAEQTRFTPSAKARAAAPKPAAAVRAPVPAAAPAAAPAPVARPQTPAQKTQVRSTRAKTLAEELMEEAREVQLSRSGRKRPAEQSASWLTRLFGAPKSRPRST
jgi:hypothetical protein